MPCDTEDELTAFIAALRAENAHEPPAEAACEKGETTATDIPAFADVCDSDLETKAVHAEKEATCDVAQVFTSRFAGTAAQERSKVGWVREQEALWPAEALLVQNFGDRKCCTFLRVRGTLTVAS